MASENSDYTLDIPRGVDESEFKYKYPYLLYTKKKTHHHHGDEGGNGTCCHHNKYTK